MTAEDRDRLVMWAADADHTLQRTLDQLRQLLVEKCTVPGGPALNPRWLDAILAKVLSSRAVQAECLDVIDWHV